LPKEIEIIKLTVSATIPFWGDVITLDDVASGKPFTRDKNHYGRLP
jgi:hypothetical protein